MAIWKLNIGSDHRRIATGFVWVSLFVLIGKLAGAGKEMAIAWRYGLSEKVDAYVFVFKIATWPVSVWFSVLTMALIPLIARYREDGDQGDGNRDLATFHREILGFSLLLGVVGGGGMLFGLHLMLAANWTGLSETALREAFLMVKWLPLVVPFGFVISLFSVWMMARGRHLNSLLEGVPALVLVIVLVLPSGLVPEPLIWGSVAGFVLHLVSLFFPLSFGGGLPGPRFTFSSPIWKVFFGGVGILFFGSLLASLVPIIDQFFAARIGPGSVSTLSYATRIVALALGLGATAIGRATLPVFSEVFAKDAADLRPMVMRWAGWVFIAGCVALAVGWALSPLIVELLFERGAFTARDTQQVADVLRFGLIRVPFYMVGIVFVGDLASRGKFHLITAIGAIDLGSKVVLNFLLVEPFGVRGIMLATAIMYLISSVLLFIASRTGK